MPVSTGSSRPTRPRRITWRDGCSAIGRWPRTRCRKVSSQPIALSTAFGARTCCLGAQDRIQHPPRHAARPQVPPHRVSRPRSGPDHRDQGGTHPPGGGCWKSPQGWWPLGRWPAWHSVGEPDAIKAFGVDRPLLCPGNFFTNPSVLNHVSDAARRKSRRNE